MNRSNDIVSRDAERDIGAELLMAVDEMLANAPVETYTITQTDVALARQKSELSQREFAETLGVPPELGSTSPTSGLEARKILNSLYSFSVQ